MLGLPSSFLISTSRVPLASEEDIEAPPHSARLPLHHGAGGSWESRHPHLLQGLGVQRGERLTAFVPGGIICVCVCVVTFVHAHVCTHIYGGAQGLGIWRLSPRGSFSRG